MNPKFVAVVRNIALIWLPAAATLAVTVGAIWNITYAQAIANTIIAVDTFLGVGLGITNVSGNGFDGEFLVTGGQAGPDTRGVLNLTTDLNKLSSRNEIRFKVKPPPKVTTFETVPPEAEPPPAQT